MSEFITDRLIIRQWTAADFQYFKNYFSNKKTARYVGGVKTPEEAWRLMAAYIGHFQLKGFGYLAVEEKTTKQFVGCVGLWDSEPWLELELGYWILEEMQGKGYATEAAYRMKDFAFNNLKVDTLVSYIDPGNMPSIKLAERLGGVFDEKIDLLDFGEHCVYRYSKNS
ncbi:MAG: GNAT family N-acetyltransferase [Bacteroidota bacterium]